MKRMNERRTAFLEAVDAARAVVAAGETSRCWDEPSVLAEYRVGGLAGHLVRATTTVVDYLSAPQPQGEPIAPPAYFAAVPAAPDLSSALHAGIRQRGEQLAA